VVKETGQDFVFLQLTDTTFRKTAVVTGSTSDTMIEIKSGLKAGDIIAAKGVFYLKSDLKKDELVGE
jgi:multidrug efflux pump subunit AcrA (membrane-fusion protein)